DPLRARREHLDRGLLQVQSAGIRGARGRSGLARRPGMDGRSRALQRPVSDRRATPLSIEPSSYFSTGRLPPHERVRALVREADERYPLDGSGATPQVYPALARARTDRFGICVAATDGTLYTAGDADHEFSIMSVSKPFVFALVCQHLRPEQARD